MASMTNLLITGGAGFIGLNLARHAITKGWHVTLLDNLSTQIHGNTQPSLPSNIRLIVGDIREKSCVVNALKD